MFSTQKDSSVFVLLGALCFSGSGTIQAFAPEEATPFVVGAVRILSAALFLLAWCGYKKLFRPLIVSRSKFILSALALAAFQVTFFLGVREAGVAVGTVVTIGMTPIAAALLGLLFYREVPKFTWYVSTAIAIFGLVLLNLRGMQGFSLQSLLFPVCAGTVYAFYLSQSKELVRQNSPILVMAWLFTAGSVFLIPIWFLYPSAWVFTPRGLSVSLALGLLSTALAYCLVMKGLTNCDTAKAATLSLGEPLGAAVLGFTVLREPFDLVSLTGIACIFLSVIVLVIADTRSDTGHENRPGENSPYLQKNT